MDITALTDYMILVIIGICLCFGYAIKSIDVIPNKFIPMVMLVLGALLNIWLNAGEITPDILLGGMMSGLASTGLHQTFYQLIYKDKGEEVDNVTDLRDLEDRNDDD